MTDTLRASHAEANMATAAISTRHNGDAREVQLSEDVIRQHALTQETAQRLSVTALRQWEKALTGIIALPTAVALSTAASVLYATSVLEQGFEIFERSLVSVGRSIAQEVNEVRSEVERKDARS